MKCPPLEQLMSYIGGGLSQTESALIEAHFDSGCRSCQQNHKWLADSIELAASEPSADVSDAVLKSMVNWFRVQPAHETRSIPRLLASLIYDSLTVSRPLAVRRGQPSSPCERQLLFRAGGYEIDLRFEGGGGVEMLVGQILTEDHTALPPGVALVKLSVGADTIASVRTEADGVFRLRDVPSGIYDLQIEISDHEIVISQVASAKAE